MKFSLAFGAKNTAVTTNLKRPLSAIHGFEDEADAAPQQVAVSAFDSSAGGAIAESNPTQVTGPLIIEQLPNRRDWRQGRHKRQRNIEAQNSQSNGSSVNDHKDIVGGSGLSYGLSVVRKEESTADQTKPKGMSEAAVAETITLTEDELALKALLGEEPKSNLVLPAVANEEEAFHRDYNEAPDAPTLEDYERVKVEDFGAALLRGMGWRDGEEISKPRLLERRPALLGLGAKDDAAVGIELGEWGKATKGKRKVDQAYNPVLLLNKQTGEKLTEEELKGRIEQQKMVEQERTSERRKRSPAQEPDYRSSEKSSRWHKYENDDVRRGSDRRRKERNGEEGKDKPRDYDSRHSSSRRDRSTSTDSRRKRKRRDDDERDSEGSKRRHRDDRQERDSSRRKHRDREKRDDSGRRRKQEVY
ncbi:hypothetical protein K432DRAFT_414210 [Lepidopterella palustris CBS 459.81]|uniref:Pre-mRNA-splicing factor n=1 Tax=Lepidopterella palustris CBS 459.81 TaxID=1314670 RepID=A0A8E2EHN8_9PEZI|nr:hypothetical protein K432DRAFT_414210 [Lepidopterella palustris CBS 459.81]